MRSVLVVLCLGAASAVAQSDAPPVDWKKTEKGAGSLFSGMGQEIKKFLGGDTKDGKPQPKKEEKK